MVKCKECNKIKNIKRKKGICYDLEVDDIHKDRECRFFRKR